jgi:phosphoglycolate phosphatase
MVRGARPDVPLKPDPAAAREMMNELAVGPERTVFVGDTDTDMKTGRRAGTLTVGVTWGFRDEDELRSSGAQHVIHQPLELIEVLGGED